MSCSKNTALFWVLLAIAVFLYGEGLVVMQ